MFFVVSKLLSFLFSPLNWVIILLVFAVFSKNARRKKRFLLSSLSLLLFFTNPLFLNLVMGWWEVPAQKIKSIDKTYEAGVMLGGTIRYMNSDVDRPVFGQAADRYLQGIELLASKKINKLILSSGSGSMLYKDAKEADFLQAQMLRLGIDSGEVIAESSSRNTHENAVETAKILNKNNVHGEVLLITSAFHMRRALACFKKEGINVIPFAVDQRSGKQMLTPDKLFIPDTEKLFDWDLLIHEWLGYFSYKVAGYV